MARGVGGDIPFITFLTQVSALSSLHTQSKKDRESPTCLLPGTPHRTFLARQIKHPYKYPNSQALSPVDCFPRPFTSTKLNKPTYVAMKRTRDQSFDMANCLMFLSHGLQTEPKKSSPVSSVFECKTCNRQFSSFQALGGHRASHNRTRLTGEEQEQRDRTKLQGSAAGNKPKMHECSICGLEFATGQALGGHMRRHRATMNEGFSSSITVESKVPAVLKRSNSKRVMCLDLNLTPLENDLKLLFGNKAPAVDLRLII